MKIITKGLTWAFWSFVGVVVALLTYGGFAVVTILGINILNDATDSYEYVESHEFDIYAFEDNVSYVVSRYSANESLRYYFVRQLEGGYKTGYVGADKSYIYETDGQPKIVVYNKTPKKFTKLYNFVSKSVGGLIPENKYRIYIPKDSIKKDFNVDLN